MKVKREYVILFGIVIVLVAYLILSGGRNRMSYRIPELEKISDETIDKVEIIHSGVKTVLSQENDRWIIFPQKYPADPVKMKDMLQVIQELTLTELAAEKKDYRRYQLEDENKISVKAYGKDELIREFDIGKTPSTYRHTFIRLSEDTRVFYAQGSFRSKFEHEIKDLRDKLVLSFDKNEATEVRIKKEGIILTFEKKVVSVEASQAEEQEEVQAHPPQPAEEEAWAMPSGEKGKKSEIDSIVSQMADLRCDEFIEGKDKQDFNEPICTVTIKGIKEYSLFIFPKEEEEGKYPAFTSENPYAFLLSTYRAENFMKKPEDLVENQETE